MFYNMPFCRSHINAKCFCILLKQTHSFLFVLAFVLYKFNVIGLTRITNEICHHILNSSEGLSSASTFST